MALSIPKKNHPLISIYLSSSIIPLISETNKNPRNPDSSDLLNLAPPKMSNPFSNCEPSLTKLARNEWGVSRAGPRERRCSWKVSYWNFSVFVVPPGQNLLQSKSNFFKYYWPCYYYYFYIERKTSSPHNINNNDLWRAWPPTTRRVSREKNPINQVLAKTPITYTRQAPFSTFYHTPTHSALFFVLLLIITLITVIPVYMLLPSGFSFVLNRYAIK